MKVPQKENDADIVLTGRIDRTRIRALRPPRVPEKILLELRALGDVTSAVSDALDELGLLGAIPASTLQPRLTTGCIVGTALTLLNVPCEEEVAQVRALGRNGMADWECHNLAQPGDILVIKGPADASNLGGVSSLLAKRQGEIGAIVDGSVRDIGDFRTNRFPVWSVGLTPQTGKWRLVASEINGAIEIQGVQVEPGDLVVADATGVCFVPSARAGDVLELVRKKVAAEQLLCDAINAGASVVDIATGQISALSARPVDVDRLPPVPAEQWSELQAHFAQKVVDGPRGVLVSPFVPLLRSPELMDLTQQLGEYLRYRSSLGARLFELTVLTVARHWSQGVEWAIHVPFALQAGLPREVIDAIGRGERPPRLRANEAVVYALSRELLETQRVGDENWTAAITELGERTTVELLGVCGYYSLLALIMNAACTPVPKEAGAAEPLPEIDNWKTPK